MCVAFWFYVCRFPFCVIVNWKLHFVNNFFIDICNEPDTLLVTDLPCQIDYEYKLIIITKTLDNVTALWLLVQFQVSKRWNLMFLNFFCSNHPFESQCKTIFESLTFHMQSIQKSIKSEHYLQFGMNFLASQPFKVIVFTGSKSWFLLDIFAFAVKFISLFLFLS